MEVSHPKALPPFYWPIGEASQPSRYRRGCQAPRWGIERTFLVLQDDGPIIPVDPASGYPTRFVSTQDLFAHSLELAQGNWLVRHDLDRRGADAQVVPVLSLVFVAVGALA
jgi:hypothetical protein